MNVWCHLPTIFNRRHVLRIAGIISLCVALITTLTFSVATHAAAGVNQTLSFQGRLLNSDGSVVPDGYYNIQFKIYQDGPGNVAGDTGGTLDWTETYTNNSANDGVYVQDGFFSVNLGSQTPFGTSVDWNDNTLWLSMNVAGDSSSCSTFNSGTCVADGEMLPMRAITSTPYSMNSGELGGLTSSNFVQIGQGAQTDSSDTSSIFINKTGTGNLAELQNAGTDVFTVGNTGNITLGNNADKTISVAPAAASSSGNTLTIAAGGGGSGSGSSGGNVVIEGGTAGGTNGTGGDISIDAGAGTGTGIGGTINIGANNASAITVGNGTTTGAVAIQSKGNANGNLMTVQDSSNNTVLSVNDNSGTESVKVGSGSGSGNPTLLTVDNASSSPTVSSSYIGSMYFDTTLGELQCYNGSSWGNCTNAPDDFVSLSPQYAGAVVHGTGTGSMTTDMCSDTLNINNGTSSQPSICGTDQTYNYYNWTSTQTSAQTKTIYVTYELPSSFKNFVSGATSLMAKTDGTDASVSYQLYRSDSNGLTACGTSIDAATGAVAWQKSGATGSNDPSSCSFAAGDSIVIAITMSSDNSANAYVSDLDFAYSTQ